MEITITDPNNRNQRFTVQPKGALQVTSANLQTVVDPDGEILTKEDDEVAETLKKSNEPLWE